MSEPEAAFYERRLQRAIEEIEAKLKDLTAEKLALQRQLMKARAERTGLADVNRKNSIGRVLVENKIIEALSEASRPMSMRSLFIEARLASFDLRESTFRTHLHRMKKRGLIEPGGHRGWWRIAGRADVKQKTDRA